MVEVIAGDTVKLRCEFKNFNNEYADPTDIILNIYYGTRSRFGEAIDVTVSDRLSAGIYEVYYTVPLEIDKVHRDIDMIYEFSGILDTYPIKGQGVFTRVYVKIPPNPQGP